MKNGLKVGFLSALGILFVVAKAAYAQTPEANAHPVQATASNAAAIPGRVSSDQLKAILAAADEDNRRAFSDLVQQTSALPSALLSIQQQDLRQYPLHRSHWLMQKIFELQHRLGNSLIPQQVDDIVEMNQLLMQGSAIFHQFAPPDSRNISVSVNQAVADEKQRLKQIESAKNAIFQVERAWDDGDLSRSNQLYQRLATDSSLPPFAQSYVEQTRIPQNSLQAEIAAENKAPAELEQKPLAAAEAKRSAEARAQATQSENAPTGKQTANAEQIAPPPPKPLEPPQSMIDYVRVAVEGLCQSAPDKSRCVAERVNSEKFQRFQFIIHDGSIPVTDADYGWLTEFNIDTCEAEASCLVVFTVFVKGTATATWWFALQYSGNFQSISHASMVDPRSTASLKISGHGIDDHIWLFDPKSFAYYDYDMVGEQQEAKKEAQAKVDEQFARAQTDGVLVEIQRVGDEHNASGQMYQRGDFLVLEIKEVATPHNTHLIACYRTDKDCGVYFPGPGIIAGNTRYLMRYAKSDYPENKAVTDLLVSGTGVEMTGPIQVLDENGEWVKETNKGGTHKFFTLKGKETHLLFPPGHDSSRCTLEKMKLGITPVAYCTGTPLSTWVTMKEFPCPVCTLTDQPQFQ